METDRTASQIVFAAMGEKDVLIEGRCYVCGGPLRVSAGNPRPASTGDLSSAWTDTNLVADRSSGSICAGCRELISDDSVLYKKIPGAKSDKKPRGRQVLSCYAEGARVCMIGPSGRVEMSWPEFHERIVLRRDFETPCLLVVNGNIHKHAFIRALPMVTRTKSRVGLLLFEAGDLFFGSKETAFVWFDPEEMARMVEGCCAAGRLCSRPTKRGPVFACILKTLSQCRETPLDALPVELRLAARMAADLLTRSAPARAAS